MRHIFLYALIMFCFSAAHSQGYEEDAYPEVNFDEWQEMNQSKQETIEWFRDAKFGMFIHWGIYSVPAGLWNGQKVSEMRRPRLPAWLMYAAEIPRAEYALISKQFNPEQFNADGIAKLARAAGMKYIVITSKHHDGFALYDSEVSEFDVMDATPFRRDIIKELHAACKDHGLAFGVYYSHNIDWFDGSDAQSEESFRLYPELSEFEKTFGANTWDPSPNSFGEYLEQKALPQIEELMIQYPGMKLLWLDMPWRMDAEQSFSFYKAVYDVQPEIIITERIGNGYGDYSIPGDNTIPMRYRHLEKPWETCGTLNNSWGFNRYDHDWKSVTEVLFWLVDIVSKGGNYLLNIGPTSDGIIPSTSVEILEAIGDWLSVNGEAIYGTKMWEISHEGPTDLNFRGTIQRAEEGFETIFTPHDFWFTRKGSAIYAISLVKPEATATIKALHSGMGDILSVKLLGIGKVQYKHISEGLIISMPDDFLPEHGFALKIELK